MLITQGILDLRYRRQQQERKTDIETLGYISEKKRVFKRISKEYLDVFKRKANQFIF